MDRRELIIVAAIAAAAPTITSFAALVTAWKTGTNIERLEKNTNSIKDALVESTRQAADAKGHEEGRLAGKAEEKSDQKKK